MPVASPSSADNVPVGQMRPGGNWGDYNRVLFVIQQAIGKLQTATLVRIVSCTNDGGLSPVGFVDVVPMVNQIDSEGTPTPHVTIYNVPYFRLQGGANAIIIDPEPGDIGLCCFASRDLSKVKSTKSQANPGSFRQYSFSDGLYVGGMLNGTPSQYVQFNAAGIKMFSPTAIVLEAPTVTINASTACTVNTPIFTVNGDTMLNGTLNQGNGSNSGECYMRGPLEVELTIHSETDVISDTISGKTHVHVDSGGSGNSGQPAT
jgi:hypothetical protein